MKRTLAGSDCDPGRSRALQRAGNDLSPGQLSLLLTTARKRAAEGSFLRVKGLEDPGRAAAGFSAENGQAVLAGARREGAAVIAASSPGYPSGASCALKDAIAAPAPTSAPLSSAFGTGGAPCAPGLDARLAHPAQTEVATPTLEVMNEADLAHQTILCGKLCGVLHATLDAESIARLDLTAEVTDVHGRLPSLPVQDVRCESVHLSIDPTGAEGRHARER